MTAININVFSDYFYKSVPSVSKAYLWRRLQLSFMGGLYWISNKSFVNGVDSFLCHLLCVKWVWHHPGELFAWYKTADQRKKTVTCCEESMYHFRKQCRITCKKRFFRCSKGIKDGTLSVFYQRSCIFYNNQ